MKALKDIDVSKWRRVDGEAVYTAEHDARSAGLVVMRHQAEPENQTLVGVWYYEKGEPSTSGRFTLSKLVSTMECLQDLIEFVKRERAPRWEDQTLPAPYKFVQENGSVYVRDYSCDPPQDCGRVTGQRAKDFLKRVEIGHQLYTAILKARKEVEGE